MFGLDNLMDLLFDSAMESINRNERVIQLLKRLNLDPDHPPADFIGVYQYALVEYGVGQPRPALAIFRQPEIQALFREALERNNPSILLKNGEAFLADSPLQADLQASHVDVRREFYAFAAIFIEVAKRTRTPAEILAEQKLASLHRQIGSLQERLNRLPTLEGIRTEIARLALPASQTPQLPPASPHPPISPSPHSSTHPPSHSPTLFPLAQQIRGWFETLGFRFEAHEVWQDDYFEWIINIPVRRGRYDRILVRGIDGEASLSDVEDLKQAVETHRTDEGWLVTARRISRAARDEVEKAENQGLGCYTLDELLDQDADFSGYLTWLEAEIQKRGIDQKYVPLACLKEEIDPDTQQRIGVSRYSDRDGWIDGYIDLWLDDPAKEHISVLGEFGTGKTWFALHYAWKALQRYRDAQRRGLERPRLPLVIPLRDYAKAVSVESLFSEFFFRKHEIPIPGYSAFEQLNRMGKLLLIFDGFDEMAARVDRQEMINNFWELAKVVVPGAKVILTCRTEHFPDAKEGRALLNAELQASTRDLTGETPQFEVLELEKFNDAQIRQVLAHQAQPTTVEQIMGNPQLLDLARRPVLTELILEALPDIEAGKPVDMSRVYLYAVRHKMERDIKAERTFTSMADKLYFMCELSWEMLSSDRMSINYREFPDRIRKLFGPAVQEEKDLDHWHYDMMGQTMLIRNADGDYTPAHRSLLEFFVAYKFAAELGAIAPDFIKSIQTEEKRSATKDAKNYTWSAYFEFRTRENGGIFHGKPLKQFIHEPIEKLRWTIGKSILAKAILDLLVPMLSQFTRSPKDSRSSKHPLVEIIEATRNQTEDAVAYTGGNAATLLARLHKSSMSYQDFSETLVKGANLSDTNLEGTNFANAFLLESAFPKIFGAIFSIAYSPNGTLLATAGETCEINLWNTNDNQLVGNLKGHTDWIRSVSFFADSTKLVSAGFDQSVRVWDLENNKCIHILHGHTNRINSVAISSDSRYVFSGSDDHTIKVWDANTGECLDTLKGHSASVEAVVFYDQGNILISGASDNTIRIWDVSTSKYIKSLSGHSNRVRALALSPDMKTLASGGRDQTIRLWNIETGKCLKILTGHSDKRVYSVAFSPNGKILASACYDQTIRLWDIETGNCIKVLQGHTDWVRAISFSLDGHVLTSGSDDQTVKHWNIEDGNCIATLQGYTGAIRSVALSPNERNLVLGCEDRCLRIWSWRNTDESILTTPESHMIHIYESRVNSAIISPNGQFIATASFDSLIQLRDIDTGHLLKTLKGHERCVNAIAFNSDGSLLASTSADCTVRLWNIQSGKCISTLEGHENWLWSVSISPDDRLIVSGGDDQVIRFWDLETGICTAELKEHRGGINSVVFTPDSEALASAGSDGIIRIWNVSRKVLIRSWLAHSSGISSLAISRDGNNLVSSGDDNSIKAWDLQTGNLIKTYIGHADRVRSVMFTQDASKIISGGSDQTVRIWDVLTGECLKVMSPLRPYEGMNITGTKGLSESERTTLKALGAIEN